MSGTGCMRAAGTAVHAEVPKLALSSMTLDTSSAAAAAGGLTWVGLPGRCTSQAGFAVGMCTKGIGSS